MWKLFFLFLIFTATVTWTLTRFFLAKNYEKQIVFSSQKYESQIKCLESKNRDLEIKSGVLTGEKQQLLLRALEQSSEIAKKTELLTDWGRKNERLGTLLEEKEKNLKEISSLREEMANQFQVISSEIVEKQKNVFHGEQKMGLSNIIDPLKIQIDDFNRKIQENSKIAQESKISIDEQIKTLVRHTGDIGNRADNLANVLRSDRKVQGNWGELRLKNLLESVGLVSGEDYVEQWSVKDRDGRRFVLDFVIKLPNGRELVLDSKVSLSNYEKYAQETDRNERIKLMQRYCEDIKNHIDELGRKKYHELAGSNSLDFVFMFLPLESAYLEAISYDNSLLTRAFKGGVALVSGSSLVPILRMVEYLWGIDKQNKNIKDIVKLAERMYEKIKKLLESIERLGNDLNDMRKTYDNVVAYVSTGRGNILRTANDIRVLAGKDRTIGEIEFNHDGSCEEQLEEGGDEFSRES